MKIQTRIWTCVDLSLKFQYKTKGEDFKKMLQTAAVVVTQLNWKCSLFAFSDRVCLVHLLFELHIVFDD